MMESLDALELPIHSHRLGNGLRVIFHKDDSTPVVAVHVCYHVGSKDDPPQRTGIAHLLEHLMFEGSRHWDDDYFKPLQEAGASVNGSTGHDYTSYYEVVPTNFLERALWLEADRMANLLPALTAAKFENQRSVVKNERHQRVDNQPYGRVSEEIYALLFPEGHPYRWPIIGTREHLDAVSMKDAADFFRQAYCPANAVVVLAGCFDEHLALKALEKCFGNIPTGTAVARRLPVECVLQGSRRCLLDEPVGLGRIDVLWPTVPRFHPDEPALDFASHILGGGKDNRLRQALERDRRLAHSVSAYQSSLLLAGQFGVRAYALSGLSPEEIEPVIVDVIETLKSELPTDDEMQRTLNAFLNQAFSRLETNLSKANFVQHQVFHKGDVQAADFLHEIHALRSVRSHDVCRVVEQYLGPHRVSVLVRVGPSQNATKDLPAGQAVPKDRPGGNVVLLPGPGPAPHFFVPRADRLRVGSLDVVLVRTRGKPRLLVELACDAGSAVEPPDQLGRAKLMAYCLDEGTAELEGPALAATIERLGAALGITAGIESSSMSLRALMSTFEESLALFAQVVSRPGFRQADVDRERDRLLAELAYKARQPQAIADEAIDELLFGPSHPYGRTSDGTPDGLAKQSSTDLFRFHGDCMTPKRSALFVVGDIEAAALERMVLSSFREWTNPATERIDDALAPILSSEMNWRVLVRPEATQTVLRIGRLAPDRKTPDYEALVLLNTVLGGQFGSRLNEKLREEMGATYGVHSSFALRRHGGSFLAGADVEAARSQESLAAILDEIEAIATDRPIRSAELDYAKAYITRRFPARFETQSGILSHLTHMVVYGLPLDYYDGYLDRIAAVTLDDVHRVARRSLSRAGMKVVVVAPPKPAAAIEDFLARYVESITIR